MSWRTRPGKKDPPKLCELNVTLLEVQPPVWRRLLMSADASLHRLHRNIQIAMGWEDRHLYEFRAGGQSYGDLEREGSGRLLDARTAKVKQLLPDVDSRILYEYDPGDGWEHEVRLVQLRPPDPTAVIPACLDGARACPPEDVGGPTGYAEFLAAIRNPSHPEHGSMLAWCGGGFDPELFDSRAVNAHLARFRRI
jgi:hypothetical protein